MIRPFSGLRDDPSGNTIIEFAIILPPMLMLIMGLGDLLFQTYAQAVLTGEVQKAARDSGIEASNLSAVDTKVVSRMTPLLKNLTNSCGTGAITGPTWCSTRQNYDTFSEIAPEPFTDGNGNGVRDPGECYTDMNGNKTWDADPGLTGQGGASAVTRYTMQVRFPRIFPVAKLMGWSGDKAISASTVLKNQPFATQTTTTATTVCKP